MNIQCMTWYGMNCTKNVDIEYGKFSASLTPGAGNIIGVRIPVLRKMAKEIASVNWKAYRDGARDDTFEEVMLQGLVLGYAKGKIEDILLYLDRFIPKNRQLVGL